MMTVARKEAIDRTYLTIKVSKRDLSEKGLSLPDFIDKLAQIDQSITVCEIQDSNQDVSEYLISVMFDPNLLPKILYKLALS
ncbi:MAG: hypothetical protein R3B41_00905 [Candidatus Doudnabacteria bacterium]